MNYGVQSFCPLLTTADFVARREDVEEEEEVVGSSALSLSHHFFPPSLSQLSSQLLPFMMKMMVAAS